MSLKVGVVGMRGIGTKHAGCHKEDELAELVAVCDVIKEVCVLLRATIPTTIEIREDMDREAGIHYRVE